MRVQASFIRLLASVRTIIAFVSLMVLLTLVMRLFLSIRMVSSLQQSVTTKDSTSKTLTKRSWLTSSHQAAFFHKAQLSTRIPSAGDHKPHSSTEVSTAGSSKWLISNSNFWLKTPKRTGCLSLLKKRDSTTGFQMLAIGVSRETGIGAIQFLSGCLMMAKKSFASAQFLSLSSFPEWLALRIFTVSLLIKLLFPQNKERVNLSAFQKSLTAGLNLDLCLSLKATTPSLLTMNSSKKCSQQTLSLRVSIKLVDGSTHWWLLHVLWKAVRHSKTWS